MISAVAYRCRVRSLGDGYESALAVWLVIQVLLVAYPYKQYYAPWFLFAAGFLVYLYRDVSNLVGNPRVLVLLTVCGLPVAADLKMARRWSDLAIAQMDQALVKWMNRVTRPGDRVVASPPLHPIDRFDSFFIWFNTLDHRGYDSERILGQLPLYQNSITSERFRRELARSSSRTGCPVRRLANRALYQRAASSPLRLCAYGRLHGSYGGSAWFALRPDRFQAAQRDGLLEAVDRRLPGLP